MLDSWEARKLTKRYGDEIRFVSFRRAFVDFEAQFTLLGPPLSPPVCFVCLGNRSNRLTPPSESLLRRLQESSSLPIRSCSRIDSGKLRDLAGAIDATTGERGRLFTVEVACWTSPRCSTVHLTEYYGPLAAVTWRYELGLDEKRWKVIEAVEMCRS